MKVRTNLKAGRAGIGDARPNPNHNETLVRDAAKGVKVKTHVKAGRMGFSESPAGKNHNETLVRDAAS